jgi:hypothetical protein
MKSHSEISPIEPSSRIALRSEPVALHAYWECAANINARAQMNRALKQTSKQMLSVERVCECGLSVFLC